jgi:hypothetical protein
MVSGPPIDLRQIIVVIEANPEGLTSISALMASQKHQPCSTLFTGIPTASE